MTQEVFIFEGLMSFEERCAAAKEHMLRARKTVEEIIGLDLQALQELEAKNKERAGSMGESAMELLNKWHQERMARVAKSSEELTKLSWDSAIELSRSLYGPDATDFAAEAINRERKSN